MAIERFTGMVVIISGAEELVLLREWNLSSMNSFLCLQIFLKTRRSAFEPSALRGIRITESGATQSKDWSNMGAIVQENRRSPLSILLMMATPSAGEAPSPGMDSMKHSPTAKQILYTSYLMAIPTTIEMVVARIRRTIPARQITMSISTVGEISV